MEEGWATTASGTVGISPRNLISTCGSGRITFSASSLSSFRPLIGLSDFRLQTEGLIEFMLFALRRPDTTYRCRLVRLTHEQDFSRHEGRGFYGRRLFG